MVSRLSRRGLIYNKISKATKDARASKRDRLSKPIANPVSRCAPSTSLYNGFKRELMTLSFISDASLNRSGFALAMQQRSQQLLNYLLPSYFP